ncbi:MAG: hypothetical protein ABIR56_04980 [Polaromonas sp.]
MNDSNALSDLLADLAHARFNFRPLTWPPTRPASLSQAYEAALAVADAGLDGLLLVGHRIKLPAGTASLDVIQELAGLRVRLYGDGLLKDEGIGANVLDGPVQALLHFVRELRATPGAPALKAGDLVITSTLTDAHPVLAGQTWHTEIESPGALEGLTVRFK